MEGERITARCPSGDLCQHGVDLVLIAPFHQDRPPRAVRRFSGTATVPVSDCQTANGEGCVMRGVDELPLTINQRFHRSVKVERRRQQSNLGNNIRQVVWPSDKPGLNTDHGQRLGQELGLRKAVASAQTVKGSTVMGLVYCVRHLPYRVEGNNGLS